MTLKEVACDCDVSDKCPNGSLGSSRRCSIMIDEDRIMQDSELIRRERDRLWCRAICTVLSLEGIAKVTHEAIKLRDNAS